MIAEVIVDVSSGELDKVFDYDISSTNAVCGSRVIVPFGNRLVEGFVIKIKEKTDCPIDKLKKINKVCDDYPVIKQEMLVLMDKMIELYNIRKIDVLRLFLPTELRTNKVSELFKKYLSLKDKEINDTLKNIPKNAKNQREIINYLFINGESEFSELSLKYGNSSVNSLIDKGIIIVNEKQIYRNVEMIKKEDNNFVLTDQQKNAIDIIKNSFGEVVLLHGVTGSGKTEVYMHAISEILKLNKTAIMLVPEISLTPQVLSNFKSRFGEKVAILHSGLSAGERYDEWLKLFRGEAKIAVGARSAIFAPLENLGLIVIDEEHDSSYNSDSNPRYNTIEVAKLRAKYNNACLVLGSATPSIESYYYSKIGEYKLVELIGRVNNKAMPTINIVDMYGALLQGEYGTFSNTLIEKLNRCILDKKQAIIFINRRGFVSFLMCTKCGYVPKCTDCDVDLVYHKDDNLLKCHYCDKRYKVLTKCPNCGGTEFRNGAIGTQKVAEELKNLFPNVPIFRMDNDTTRTKNAHLKILSQFGETKPSILVGTQMIAKGHDFPFVTLVGIVDADISLHQSDFRATEKTFQLVTQVSGRAGRSDYTGEVVLQTYSPKHYVYRYASSYDYKGFFEKECDIRKTTMFPPFAKIIRIIFSYEEENILVKVVKNAFDKINELKENYKSEFIFCKAMACPVKKIKTKLRYQILLRIKTDKEKEIIEQIFNIVDNLEKNKVSVFIETNPNNLS